MFNTVNRVAKGLAVTAILASTHIAMTVHTLTVDCSVVNELKAGAQGNPFSSLLAKGLGLAQAFAGLLALAGVIGLIAFFATKWRGKLASITLTAFLIVTFGGAIVGFITNNATGGCSFL